MGATISGQSKHGSNGNKGALNTTQIFKTVGSASDIV